MQVAGKFTRRTLAAALAVPAAAALAQPQVPLAAAPGDELTSARERLGTATTAVARQEVPMPAEPAFQFKA